MTDLSPSRISELARVTAPSPLDALNSEQRAAVEATEGPVVEEVDPNGVALTFSSPALVLAFLLQAPRTLKAPLSGRSVALPNCKLGFGS